MGVTFILTFVFDRIFTQRTKVLYDIDNLVIIVFLFDCGNIKNFENVICQKR